MAKAHTLYSDEKNLNFETPYINHMISTSKIPLPTTTNLKTEDFKNGFH
jgi:hypothetical protein